MSEARNFQDWLVQIPGEAQTGGLSCFELSTLWETYASFSPLTKI